MPGGGILGGEEGWMIRMAGIGQNFRVVIQTILQGLEARICEDRNKLGGMTAQAAVPPNLFCRSASIQIQLILQHMLCNEVESGAENQRGKDGYQRGREDDFPYTVVTVVADPEKVSEHSAGKGGGIADNGVDNLEDHIFPNIPEESAGHFMFGKKLAQCDGGIYFQDGKGGGQHGLYEKQHQEQREADSHFFPEHLQEIREIPHKVIPKFQVGGIERSIYQRQHADADHKSGQQGPNQAGKKFGQHNLPCGYGQGVGQIAFIGVNILIIADCHINGNPNGAGCDGQDVKKDSQTQQNIYPPNVQLPERGSQ